MDAAWSGSGVRSLSGTTTGAEMDGVSRVPQLPRRLLLFAFLSLWFFLCVIKTAAVCRARILSSPAAPNATPSGRTAPSGACWEHRCWMELGRSLPGGRPAWTCSPVSPERNTHEPRALLTLLSPGVQMRVTSLKKAGLGFQKPKSFFFFN